MGLEALLFSRTTCLTAIQKQSPFFPQDLEEPANPTGTETSLLSHLSESKSEYSVRGMAYKLLKRTSFMEVRSMASKGFASVAVGTNLISHAPNASLQKARSWDEGVSSNFATTPLKDIFKEKKVVIFGLPGAYTGVCSQQHVPGYKNNVDKLKAKGVDSVLCVAINDPYVMNGWAENIQAKEAIEFYGDFDGSFHKSLQLDTDLSAALLGTRAKRWSAYVVDGKIQVLNVEEKPSEVKVSGADTILGQI